MSGYINIIRRIGKIFQKKKNQHTENQHTENQKIDNSTEILTINKTENSMAKKTVITKVLDVNTSDAIIEFPQNRTLMVEQLTDSAPTKAEFKNEFSSMQDVFDNYKPNADVEFEDAQGRTVKENLAFNELKDFETEQLLKNSPFLQSLKLDRDAYEKIALQLMKNKPLKEALMSEDSKENLVKALQALLAELQ